MSVILITNHDENIKKIADETTVQNERAGVKFKAKLHVKFKAEYPVKTLDNKPRARIKADYPVENLDVKPHATMGVPQETLPDPCDFLKKGSGKLAYAYDHSKMTIEKSTFEKKPTCIPTQEDIKNFDQKRKEAANLKKNFIVENVKHVLKMKPKEPEPRIVLEPHGESKCITDGLEPVYIKSEAFGKTPDYLQVFIKNREKHHQMQKDSIGVEKPKCHYIRRDEREQLLKGLKHNWEELQKQYQGLPILTDTIPKINRKSKLEAELKQLEKDIVLVERHPYIYVYDDNVISFS